MKSALPCLLFFGCAHAPVTLVETTPIETSLDSPLPAAHEVWLRMIQRAEHSIDLAHFYISNKAGSRLEPIIAAIEARASAGVKVRVLIEKQFSALYPQTLARLAKAPGVELRRYDIQALTQGILHAKYFIIDRKAAYLGSQNFDWRALTHIQELGVHLRDPKLVAPLNALFSLDWDIAGGATPKLASGQLAPGTGNEKFALVSSPKGLLPEGARFDLPALIALIDGAQKSVRVQLLSYKPAGRDGTPFPDLDDALRRAATRGVKVQLLLSHWCTAKDRLPPIRSLQKTEGIEVKIATIPQWSGGFVPFARVIHAKYMVVDGTRGWIGTSNWSRDYFYNSRNVGLLVQDEIAGQLDGFFERTWSSEYSAALDPDRSYPAPRIKE